MGNRAIYTIVEEGKSEHFYAHNGANALSPVMRLQQAMEIQAEIPNTISHIFQHLSRAGEYQNPPLDSADMFCYSVPFDPNESRVGKGIEMYITINLDEKKYVLDFNEHYPMYISMGSYEIPLEVGLDSLNKVFDYANQEGIQDFYEVLKLYNDGTGISNAMEHSKQNQKEQDFLDSPEAENMRNKLKSMMSRDLLEERGG